MHIYLITNLINGKQYVGAERKNNSEYYGSGKLIKEAIEKSGRENFKKEILIGGEYIDNWEECLKLESVCILSLNTLWPNGYNITWWNWPIPTEILSRGGKIGAKRLHELYPELASEAGKRVHELYPELASEAGKIGGKIGGKIAQRVIAEKRRVDPSYDREYRNSRTIAGKIGAKRLRELYPKKLKEWSGRGGKIGGKRVHELYPEMASKIGKITGPENLRRWKEEHSEELSKIGENGGKNGAHILFEIDGLIQRMTLGAILKA